MTLLSPRSLANKQNLRFVRREIRKEPTSEKSSCSIYILPFDAFQISTMKFSSFASLILLISSVSAFAPIQVSLARPTLSSSSSALGVAVDTSDIKNGMTLELDGEPYKVLSFSIMKQARGAAKTTIKFKNLIRGTTIENTYRSGEKFETALIEKKAHQFTYEDGVSLFNLWNDPMRKS